MRDERLQHPVIAFWEAVSFPGGVKVRSCLAIFMAEIHPLPHGSHARRIKRGRRRDCHAEHQRKLCPDLCSLPQTWQMGAWWGNATTCYFGGWHSLLHTPHIGGENIPLAPQPPWAFWVAARPWFICPFLISAVFIAHVGLSSAPPRSSNTKNCAVPKQLPNTTGANTPETQHPTTSTKGSRKVLHHVPVGFTNPTGLLAGSGSHNWNSHRWKLFPCSGMEMVRAFTVQTLHCRGKGGAPAESIAMWLLFVSC